MHDEHVCFSTNAPFLFESEPTATQLGGRWLLAWLQWRKGGLDGVAVRWLDGGASKLLSSPDATAGHPRLVAAQGGAWLVWESCRDGQWAVVGRRLDGDAWSAERAIADDAFDPALAVDASGTTWCAYVQMRAGRRTLCAVNLDNAGQPLTVPTVGAPCYRPRLTLSGVRLWATWEGYFDLAPQGTTQEGQPSAEYRVCACQIGPSGAGGPLMVSHGPGNDVLHTTCASSGGALVVAWINSRDVENADGVVDQWQTVQAARAVGPRWERLPEATDLCQGMLVNAGAGGYLGNRRKPMLVADGDGVWAVWERKDLEDGHTRRAIGILCGKRLDGDVWSAERELVRGLIAYDTAPVATDGKLAFVGRNAKAGAQWDSGVSNVFEDGWANLEFGEAALGEHLPGFQAATGTGWRMVTLRDKRPPLPRRPVGVGEGSLSLFWGDPHFHTAQTGDAEGEVDELLHYARDKAGLDYCAICDNDVYCLPLAEHAWRRQHRLIEEHSEPGRFAVIPSNEWSWADPETKKPNHRLALFAKSGEPLFHQFDDEGCDIDALASSMGGTSGLLIGHHLGWVFADSPVEAAIEVASAWSPHMVVKPEAIHHTLSTGRRLGFTGGSDSHRRNPGFCGALTGIYAAELTAAALVDAIRRRRTIATTGTRIAIDFRIADAFIGDDVRLGGRVPISVRAFAPRPIETLAVIRDGQVIASLEDVNAIEAELALDEGIARGTHWYYARAVLVGDVRNLPNNDAVAQGTHAWTSPIWVTSAS